MSSAYPSEWEGTVVLHDGRTCDVRPIGPDDADRLRAFHHQLSDRTIYYRFFSPHATLSNREVQYFTEVDHINRVALVALHEGDIVGVARYDRTGAATAEVAFVIRDDFQGQGLGSALLMRLARAARDREIMRFTAEVLPGNRRMLATFESGGFVLERTMDGTVMHVEFDIVTA